MEWFIWGKCQEFSQPHPFANPPPPQMDPTAPAAITPAAITPAKNPATSTSSEMKKVVIIAPDDLILESKTAGAEDDDNDNSGVPDDDNLEEQGSDPEAVTKNRGSRQINLRHKRRHSTVSTVIGEPYPFSSGEASDNETDRPTGNATSKRPPTRIISNQPSGDGDGNDVGCDDDLGNYQLSDDDPGTEESESEWQGWVADLTRQGRASHRKEREEREAKKAAGSSYTNPDLLGGRGPPASPRFPPGSYYLANVSTSRQGVPTPRDRFNFPAPLASASTSAPDNASYDGRTGAVDNEAEVEPVSPSNIYPYMYPSLPHEFEPSSKSYGSGSSSSFPIKRSKSSMTASSSNSFTYSQQANYLLTSPPLSSPSPTFSADSPPPSGSGSAGYKRTRTPSFGLMPGSSSSTPQSQQQSSVHHSASFYSPPSHTRGRNPDGTLNEYPSSSHHDAFGRRPSMPTLGYGAGAGGISGGGHGGVIRHQQSYSTGLTTTGGSISGSLFSGGSACSSRPNSSSGHGHGHTMSTSTATTMAYFHPGSGVPPPSSASASATAPYQPHTSGASTTHSTQATGISSLASAASSFAFNPFTGGSGIGSGSPISISSRDTAAGTVPGGLGGVYSLGPPPSIRGGREGRGKSEQSLGPYADGKSRP